MKRMKKIRIGHQWRMAGIVVWIVISFLAAVVAQNSAGTNTFLESNRLKKSRVGSKVMRERLLRTEMNVQNYVAPLSPNIVRNVLSTSSGSSSIASIATASGSETPTRSKSYPPRPASLNSLHKFDNSLTIWDDSRSVCHTVPGLTRDQLSLCYRNPEAVTVAITGIQMASEECAHQMEKNRWNCSSLQGSINPHSTNLLQKGYRESAFGHAIAAAGVAYAVAKACSQGKLLSCGCGLQYDDQVNYFPSKEPNIGGHFGVDESTNDLQLLRQSGTSSTSWKWSGCSHNMDFGMKFAKLFLDAREKSADLPSRINLHNNRVGRVVINPIQSSYLNSIQSPFILMKDAVAGPQSVIFHTRSSWIRRTLALLWLMEKRVFWVTTYFISVRSHYYPCHDKAVAGNMEVRCKCHGLSGSCELRTCWRSAPNFRRVGAELKNKFRRAVLIDQSEFGNRPPNRVENNRVGPRQKRRQRRDRRQSRAEREASIDLWYYEKSPTYCDSNRDFNIPGTSGRRCNKTEVNGAGGCNTLCCGRGYNTIRQVSTTRCKCNFIWCCQVVCQTCVVDEWITVCK